MWEYYLINDICLVYDSPLVTGFWHWIFSYSSPYSGVGFFSVFLLTVWTKWGQSAYLGFSFWLNFSPSCPLIRVTGDKKNLHIHFLNVSNVLLLFLSPSLHSSPETCFSRCCPIISFSLMVSATTHKNRLEVKIDLGYVCFRLKEGSQENIQKVCERQAKSRALTKMCSSSAA